MRDKCFLSSDLCVSFRLISRSTVDTPKVSQSIVAVLRLPGFLGIPSAMLEAGQSGAFEWIATVERRRPKALRFNIVISVAFAEPGKHVSASYVFHALEPPRTYIEYTISFLILPYLAPLAPYEISFFHLVQKTQCIPFVLFERNS